MQKSLDDILTGRLRKDELVSFLKKHPELFDEAVKTSLGDQEPQSWRAAWLVYHYMEDNDPVLLPHVDSIVSCILKKEDGHQREFLKILSRMELNDEQEGRLFDVCLTIWEEINRSPSVRGTAFQTILNLVKKYPELKSEIGHLTQSHYTETLSPGIKHSFNKLISRDGGFSDDFPDED